MNILNAFKKKGLILLLLSLFATQAFATPQKLLTNLHKMRLSSTESLTNFYMYSGLDADAKYGKKIINSLAEFEDMLKNTRLLPAADGVTDSLDQIAASWDTYQKLIRLNYSDMETRGFPNVRFVNEMGETNASLLKVLTQAYDDAKITTGISPNEVVETARSLSSTMEKISSQYAARGTSSLGHVFIGSYEQTLEEMAVDFNLNLESLKKQVNYDSNKKVLRSIDSKWNFIERSIKNYNENTIPFLVSSYSERIIEDLEQLADSQ